MTKIILRGQNANLILKQTGRTGPEGPQGPAGEGVPAGGTTGEVLTKLSNTDFDTEWEPVPSAPVQSVNGQTGVVVLDKTDIGLGNVDNTSDLNKPISTATQAALDDKADEDGVILIGGQSPPTRLEFGTTNAQGMNILLNGNPFIRITSIGNMGINVGSDPSVPFLVGGGLFTSAGSVFAQINPDSGTELAIGTTTNHPVNLHANGTTALTLNTDGSVDAGANSMSSTFVPSSDDHLTNKLYVDNAVSGVSTAWGSITGTLSDQTDLQSALDAKYDASNPSGYISGVAWGDITGTLSAQTDLQAALNDKADATDLSNYVLKSGDTMSGPLIVNALLTSSPSLTASSGTQNGVLISPSINQSGTAGWEGYTVNVTESGAGGSGNKFLFIIRYNGATRTSIDRNGLLNVGGSRIINVGNPTIAADAVNLSTLNGRFSQAQRAAVDALDTGTSTLSDVINALQA